jgi:cytoskeletal protein CcmA (bactofilin family)
MSDSHPSELAVPAKRRFLDRRTSTPTLVAAGTRFEGDLTCPGDASVAGEVVGRGQVNGMLILSDSGRWCGTVQCAAALLAGIFEGGLMVAGKLEIRASARIKGSLTATHIAVAEGAIIEGDLAVTSGAGVVRFTEKRHG